MGIKERQERDREAVSRSILDAARELFVAEGYGNVSIRKIAEQIEYSPAAIYGYFPSKDDIFYALAEEGFRLLLCARQRAAHRRRARQARAARPHPHDLLASLRVQPAAPAVLRADVHRPVGAPHQPGVRAVRVRPRDEGAPGRRRFRPASTPACCRAPQRHVVVPAADDGADGRGDDAALRSPRPAARTRTPWRATS